MAQAGVKDADSFPFVLIGNKSDKEEKKEVDEDRGKSGASKLSKIHRFFETSAKDGTNVDTCFNQVIELAASQVKEDNLYVAPSLNLGAGNKADKKKKGCCGKG